MTIKFQSILTSLTMTLILTSTATVTRTEAIQGVFTKWDTWSPCDVTCGLGFRTRYRACYPIGADCIGNVSEKNACVLTPCPIVGKWSEWTKWTNCTKSCGIGMQTKYRSCLSEQNQCFGSNREVKICSTNPCNVSGGWSAWNDWSSCSEPCGRGVRYQDRTCEDPAPSGGGISCRGIGTKIGFCFEKPCSDKISTQISVFDGKSYLEFDKTFVAKKLLSLFIKFKPEKTDGLILYRHHGINDTNPSRNETLVIKLEDSRVEIYVQYAGIATSMRNSELLEMNKWHNVFVAVVATRLVLRVNNGIATEKKFENLEMEKVDFDQQMFIGGLSETFTSTTSITHSGFVGWISTLRISFEEYFLDGTEEITPISEETNHPIFSHKVEKWNIEAEELYPTFNGDDYSVFSCSDCHGKPDILIEVVIKPFKTSSGLVWSNFGEEAGSYLMLFFRKNSLVFCMNLGSEKMCTTTEPISEKRWLTVTVAVKSKQAKLRLNNEHAYILTSDGEPYRARPPLHFAGGELDYWTLVYFVTKQIRGFSGILYSLSINKKDYNVLREVAMRETRRLISAFSASVAAKYDEFHEPPSSEVEFQCDLSVHEDRLGVSGGVAFWLREGEIIQNFSSMNIQKVPGMKHATKLTIRNREIGDQDGFYGCLLRTGHYEILVHVFGVSFDDANDIDFVEISETAVLIAAMFGSLCVLGGLLALLKSGFVKRFPPYNAIMQRMPSWFTEGHRKNFLLRQTCSLQRTGQLPADYIEHLLTMQEKAVQTPSAMDLSRLHGQSRDGLNFALKETNQITDPDSDYNRPIPRKKSDGTVFPKPLIGCIQRPSQLIQMKIPDHVKKSPEKYLPGRFVLSETSGSESERSRTTGTIQSSTSKTSQSANGTGIKSPVSSYLTSSTEPLMTTTKTDETSLHSLSSETTERNTFNRTRTKERLKNDPKRKVKFRHQKHRESTSDERDSPIRKKVFLKRKEENPEEEDISRKKKDRMNKPGLDKTSDEDEEEEQEKEEEEFLRKKSETRKQKVNSNMESSRPDLAGEHSNQQFQRRSHPGYSFPQFPQYGTPPATPRRQSSLPDSPIYPYPVAAVQPPYELLPGVGTYDYPPHTLAYPRPAIMPQNIPVQYPTEQLHWQRDVDPYGQWETQLPDRPPQEQLYYLPPQEFGYGGPPPPWLQR